MKQNSYNWESYLQWFISQGGFIDNIKLEEKDGVRGLYANASLQQNKIIVAIPNNLVISTLSVQKSNLKGIFKLNPNLYDSEVNEEADYNKLALFVFHEKLKGTKSFYHPMFSITPNPSTILQWTREEIYELKDPYLIKDALNFQQLMDEHWKEVKNIISKQQNLFPQSDIHKQEYYWSYQYVMTRVFGWRLPSPALLLPIAEFQNHKSGGTVTDHICFHRDFEEAPNMIGKHNYKLKKEYFDVSIIKTYKGTSDHKNKIAPLNQELKRTYIEDNYELLDNKPQSLAAKIEQINYKKLETQNDKQVFELDYFSSSEDDDEDLDESQYEYEQDIHDYKDNDYDWYSVNDANVFYCLVTLRPYQKGEEIFCSYGRKSSRYLLKWYGFIEKDSPYDSIKFQLFMNQRKQDFPKYVFKDYIGDDDFIEFQNKKIPKSMLSKTFKLQKNSLCEDLMIYIRNIILEQKNIKVKTLSLPQRIDYEIELMNYMLEILIEFQKDFVDLYESNSEENAIYQSKDPQLRFTSVSFAKLIAIRYRQNLLSIVQSQKNIIQFAQKVLKNLSEQLPLKLSYINIQTQDKPHYIYCLRNYIRQLKLGLNLNQC